MKEEVSDYDLVVAWKDSGVIQRVSAVPVLIIAHFCPINDAAMRDSTQDSDHEEWGEGYLWEAQDYVWGWYL